jgi:hypothetical protein
VPLLRECLAIRERRLPRDDWMRANAESTLGECLTALGRFEEAEPLVAQSYPRIAAVLGADHVRAEIARGRIRALYRAWGRPEPADLAPAEATVAVRE